MFNFTILCVTAIALLVYQKLLIKTKKQISTFEILLLCTHVWF
jgi:hypothetical protein